MTLQRETEKLPAWLRELGEEDIQFVRRFILASGSLKELARQYSVSYPTVRSRLDRLIAKVKALEDAEPVDPFERKIRVLVAEGRLPASLGKEILRAHRESLKLKEGSSD